MNRYKVTFVFDYTTISTNVISPDEDSCPDVASDMVYEDLGYSNLSSLLNNAQDIVVELVEENVL
jgi:hypothetical protein